MNMNMIKPTTIKSLGKRASGARAPNTYDPNIDISFDKINDPIIMNDMVKDIEMLDKDAHEQIYKLIRKFRPAKWFTTDCTGTHFDRTVLTDSQIYELYRTVKLCKDHMMRMKVINGAKNIHDVKMNDLSNNIDCDNIMSLDEYDTRSFNLSEKEKTEQMIQLNK